MHPSLFLLAEAQPHPIIGDLPDIGGFVFGSPYTKEYHPPLSGNPPTSQTPDIPLLGSFQKLGNPQHPRLQKGEEQAARLYNLPALPYLTTVDMIKT